MTTKTNCRDCRKLRKSLESMTMFVRSFLDAIDEEMKKPSSPDRGSRIATLTNLLDSANDRIRYFDLGVDYLKDKKRRVTESILTAAAALEAK